MSDREYTEDMGDAGVNKGDASGYHMTEKDKDEGTRGINPIVGDGNVESGLSTDDSDKQIDRDDREAIDESNIIDDRTRGAGPEGGYQEPGDTEGLPEDDGRSQGAYSSGQ